MVLAELVDSAVAGATRAADPITVRSSTDYRVMPRPVVSMLGELECWVTFSPRAQISYWPAIYCIRIIETLNVSPSWP